MEYIKAAASLKVERSKQIQVWTEELQKAEKSRSEIEGNFFGQAATHIFKFNNMIYA